MIIRAIATENVQDDVLSGLELFFLHSTHYHDPIAVLRTDIQLAFLGELNDYGLL